jgi:hypothetical protein
MTATISTVAMNFQKLYSYRFQGVDLQKKMAVWQPIAERIFDAMGNALDPNSVDTVIFLNKFPGAHHAQS